MTSPASGTGIFPLPGVGPPLRPTSRSRRVQARYASARFATDLANDAIASLNCISTSFSQAPLQASRSSSTTSSSTLRLVANVYRCARRYASRSSSDLSDGFSSLKLDSSYGYSQPFVTAMPLISDRVALPSVAGEVDLLKALPPDVAAVYADPSRCLRPPGAKLKSPTPRVFASHEEYVKLLRRMVASNMLTWTTDPKCINGLFAVAKDDGSQRLVVDGRPSCNVFVDSPPVVLPTPDLLAKLRVPPDKTLWVAKSDLADFFYRFAIPEWMHPYFALPSVLAEELDLLHLFPRGTKVYPCLRVLAMGWSHSVYLTQKSHERLLDGCPRLPPQDRITPTSDLNVDRVRHLVYVDDVVIVGTDPVPVALAQDEYIAEAAVRRLPVKPVKVVRPTCTGLDCLGMEVDGVGHTVGLRVDKLQRLCADTRYLLRQGQCSGRDMARLVGRWTWAMLVNRPALSAFNAVYRFIRVADRRCFDIWPTVRTELKVAIGFAPLLFATLSSPWFDRVVATDASLDGQGVVAARVPEDVVDAVAAHSGILVSPDPVSEAALNKPLLAERWSTIVSSRWQDEEHINRLEARAVGTAIRWVLSSPLAIGRRLLVVSDSQVVVGALAKGRSSSHSLLRVLRGVAALLLASGLRIHMRWVASADNPADGPSRNFR